ncbi:MAG: hypothetical protein Q9217_002011 [Psora testacea]
MSAPLSRSTVAALTRTCLPRAPSHISAAAIRASSPCSHRPYIHQQRPLSQSAWLSFPRKDSQDKDSINAEATEYSKSATDDQGARQDDPAFNPEVTDPQEEKDVAEDTRGVSEPSSSDSNNPLDVSPANPDVSKPRGDSKGGAQNSSGSSGAKSDRPRSSGGSSAPKGSKVR